MGGVTWLSRALRLLAAVGLALLVVVVPSSASWASHTPTPRPAGNSEAASWTCERVTTNNVTGSTAVDHCVVTAWATPSPTATPTVAPSPSATSSSSGCSAPTSSVASPAPCWVHVASVGGDLLWLFTLVGGVLAGTATAFVVARLRR